VQQAIRDGGISAGLEIHRIINAPTAAGLAYNLDNTSNNNHDERLVLVFNLRNSAIGKELLLQRRASSDIDFTRCYRF
jgi:hypothetical protein